MRFSSEEKDGRSMPAGVVFMQVRTEVPQACLHTTRQRHLELGCHGQHSRQLRAEVLMSGFSEENFPTDLLGPRPCTGPSK